ncbi:TIGR00341 family protein [Heliorestis acidaminivorans]|uniref:TIGR00341 family protein n=1 Tax=Heliorestis acidaminivorans TaxID=553427 RepID=UPI00147910EA|nr:TIGR00341 family protein [Heliorestis acidaminivorans]
MQKIVAKISEEQKQNVYNDLSEAGQANGYFYLMVSLSGIVATLGLLTNSAAVIIGAMLIAPLMNPIISGSLAITLGDTQLLRRASFAELTGLTLAIVLATFITLLSPTRELTPEILARIEPTLFDLLIALASGAAGAYTITYHPKSSALPGVAIATALMPPLCVVGIGLATYEYSVVMGGFLLFLANLIAISLASSIVFLLAGFTSKFSGEKQEVLNVRQRFTISIALLVIISIPLITIMARAIDRNQTDKLIYQSLTDNLQIIPRTELVSYNYQKESSGMNIYAVVRSPEHFTPNQLREIENLLEHKLKAPVSLQMQMVRVAEVDRHSLVDSSIEERVVPAMALSTETESSSLTLNNPEKLIEDILIEKSRVSPDFEWKTFSFSYYRDTSTYRVTIHLEPEAIIDSSLTNLLTNLIEDRLKRKVTLSIIQPVVKESSEVDEEQRGEEDAIDSSDADSDKKI